MLGCISRTTPRWGSYYGRHWSVRRAFRSSSLGLAISARCSASLAFVITVSGLRRPGPRPDGTVMPHKLLFWSSSGNEDYLGHSITLVHLG